MLGATVSLGARALGLALLGLALLASLLGRRWSRRRAAAAMAGLALATSCSSPSGGVDPRQRELACQHQPGWTSAHDHDRMGIAHASLIANLVDRWKLEPRGDS